jgi:tetratricopeptide (TPR) repeat protein
MSWAAAPRPGVAAGPGLGSSLVQVIDTEVRDDHADISVQFACSVRFLGNTPVSHGDSTRITLRLGPDCGDLLSAVVPEFPLVGGGGDLVTGARVEQTVPGEVSLELSWARELDFVMAPTGNSLGLRVRLIGIAGRKPKVAFMEPELPTGYAVNLDSARENFSAGAVAAAAGALKVQAYVSETDIEGEHWWRLRAGPFATKAEAERVLNIALAIYPHAWVAVNDEQTDLALVEHAGVPTPAASQPVDAPLPDSERTKILSDARTALDKHQYPEAVELLGRLLRQPEYPARADAQELSGIARERAGQLAQAKGEYEAYLARYPDRPGAQRVRARLQALLAASLAPKSTGEFGAAQDSRWTMAGSAALGYQFANAQTVSSGTSTSTTAVNAALVYGDLLVRDRGPRYDFTGRVDGGYTQNIVTTAGGSQDRTTAAFVELTDRMMGLTGRAGRQTLANQGVIGLFDGIFIGYQVNPTFSVSAAGGYPSYTSYSALSTQQQFETISAEYGLLHEALVLDAYLFNETDQSATDRRSLGFQTRFTRPGASAVALIDYDVYFQALNSATLIGNLKIGPWVLGVDADHRHSPLLEINNALIGQSATDLHMLGLTFTPSQLKQLAIDRTALSDTFVVSANRPLAERWQFMVDIAALRLGGTPASGGVAATPATGLDRNVNVQMTGSSLVQASDLHIFGLRFDDAPSYRSTTATWDARFALPGAWRFGPRFSIEQLSDPGLGGRQMLYLPEVRGDWTSRSSVFEIIAGYQLQQQQALQQLQSQIGPAQTGALQERSLYISLTYRLRF